MFCTRTGILGYKTHIDENGDAAGHYTLLAFKEHQSQYYNYSMRPVAEFEMDGDRPVSSPPLLRSLHHNPCPFSLLLLLLLSLALFGHGVYVRTRSPGRSPRSVPGFGGSRVDWSFSLLGEKKENKSVRDLGGGTPNS